jgi:hypothetical protein
MQTEILTKERMCGGSWHSELLVLSHFLMPKKVYVAWKYIVLSQTNSFASSDEVMTVKMSRSLDYV